MFGNANRGMQITRRRRRASASPTPLPASWTGTIGRRCPAPPNSVLTKTGQGEFRFNGTQRNSRTLTTYHKLAVNEGLFRLGSVAGFDARARFRRRSPVGLLADAITLNGGAIGLSFNTTLHANRGITLGTGAIGPAPRPAA